MQNPHILTQKKTQKLKSTALLGGAMTAGGLGLAGLSHGILSDTDYDNVSTFKNLAANSWSKGQDPRENLKQYIEYGHRSISAHPLGIDAVGIMKNVRNPTLIHGLSNIAGKFGLHSQSDWLNRQAMHQGGLQHYIEFSKSPLDGYRQLSSEFANGDHGGATNTAENIKKLIKGNHFLQPGDNQISQFGTMNKGTFDPSQLDAAGLERQRNGLKSLLSDTQPTFHFPWTTRTPSIFKPEAHAQGGQYMSILNKHIGDYAKAQGLDLNSASTDQKRQVYNGLDGYIKTHDANFWKQKQFSDYSMGTLMPGAGKMYSGIINPFTGAHDLLKYTGIGAAAVGAGMGGYALYKLIRNHLAKKSTQQVRPPVQSY